jgi:hypothetical protein
MKITSPFILLGVIFLNAYGKGKDYELGEYSSD